MLENTLESRLDCKEIQPVHPKGDQYWVFFGRTDAEAEISILWPLDAKSWLIWKDPYAGKDWRQEEKGMTERWLDGITDSMDMSLSYLWEMVKKREACLAGVHGVTKSWTWLNSWTITTFYTYITNHQVLHTRDFPGDPVVKTSSSSAGSMSLIPGWGSKIPHALWPKTNT